MRHMRPVSPHVNQNFREQGGFATRKPNCLAILTILAVALLGVFNAQSAALPLRPQQQEDEAAQTVYVMRTGKKYHRADCRYLRENRIPIKLKDAVKAGYTPCSVCNPPRLTEKKE